MRCVVGGRHAGGDDARVWHACSSDWKPIAVDALPPVNDLATSRTPIFPHVDALQRSLAKAEPMPPVPITTYARIGFNANGLKMQPVQCWLDSSEVGMNVSLPGDIHHIMAVNMSDTLCPYALGRW